MESQKINWLDWRRSCDSKVQNCNLFNFLCVYISTKQSSFVLIILRGVYFFRKEYDKGALSHL